MPRHHRRFISRVPALAALSSLPLLAACGSGTWYDTPRYQEDRAASIAHVSGTAISVVNANGAVSAKADDTLEGVQIEATLYSNDPERLAFAQLRTERMADGTLDIRVEWPAPGRQRNEGAKISVFVPDAEGLSVRTSNGSIYADGLSGHADLRSSNGRITVLGHAGDVVADSSNGGIRVEHATGSVDLSTSNGAVVIEHAMGPVHAETSNGGVFVHTDDSNPGPVRVRTSNGGVELELGSAFEGVLKLDTSNARIRLSGLTGATLYDTSKNHAELRIGDSDEISAARSSNGSIVVRGSGAQAAP